MTTTTTAAPHTYDQMISEWMARDLDEWTRHVVRRHFDPETGSPYWLKRATELPFDPRDITRYAELTEFGPFPLEVLRGQDPAEMVPLAVPRPLAGRIWDSGGTTGTPCRVFYTKPMMLHRGVWRRWSYLREGFAPDRVWLHAVPTGPHLAGHGVWELADLVSAMVHSIDMDPRWVKRLIRAGRTAEVDEYVRHLLDQIADVLTAYRVDYLNTTPAVFQALVRDHPDLVARLAGVRVAGTQLTPAMYRDFVRAVDGGIVGFLYGNTFGNTAGFPPENGGEILPYVPNYPEVTMAVVDKRDWRAEVGYGEVGQVRLTVLHEDLLMPNVLERDEAVRYDPAGRWPVDGVANVRPLKPPTEMPEGIY